MESSYGRTMTEHVYYVTCIVAFFVLLGDIANAGVSRIVGTPLFGLGSKLRLIKL